MNPFKDYFYYYKKERWAVCFLFLLIGILLLINLIAPLFAGSASTSVSDWDKELEMFYTQMSALKKEETYHKKRYPSSYSKPSPTYNNKQQEEILHPFPFDPNIVTAQELEAMGLIKKVIKSWMNYRNKGGVFKDKEDVSKVYNLSPSAYEQLKEFIQFTNTSTTTLATVSEFDPNTVSPEELARFGVHSRAIRSIVNYRDKGGRFKEASDLKKIYTLPDSVYQHLAPHIKIIDQPQYASSKTKKSIAYTVIDINKASSEDFEQFRGIGPSYGRRLVEWRERLGGFVSITQVGELYKLPDSTFQQMKPFLSCPPSPLTTININTATIEELKAHPYLRWTQAKAIVQYREQKGAWKGVEWLEILPELDDNKNTFERVKPYLSVK